MPAGRAEDQESDRRANNSNCDGDRYGPRGGCVDADRYRQTLALARGVTPSLLVVVPEPDAKQEGSDEYETRDGRVQRVCRAEPVHVHATKGTTPTAQMSHLSTGPVFRNDS